MRSAWPWAPAVLLVLGAVLTMGAAKQEALPLRRPLAQAIPQEIQGYVGKDLGIDVGEAAVAGFSNYLFRIYEEPGTTEPPEASSDDVGPAGPWFSLYVGYYESQAQGRTIHSPKNCLPGAGWEPLSSSPVAFEVEGRTVTVNKYVIQNGNDLALVLYWYQGRGRVAHNEYWVKFDLLRDAALRRRSDEALVRIVVPVLDGDTEAALSTAGEAAEIVIPMLDLALPSAPEGDE